MRKFIDCDNKLYNYFYKLADYLLLNFIWIIFCIPIVTIGVSSTALYYTFHKVLKNSEGTLWNTFWNTFKSNFKQGILLWIIYLFIFSLFGIDIYFTYILSKSIPIMSFLLLIIPVIAIFTFVCSIYSFAYISHINDNIGTVLKNSVLICVMNLPYTLLLVIGFVFCIFSIAYFSFGPLLIFVLPVLYTHLQTWIFEKVFSKYWNI